ncbi:type I methionyl aminopeptidase [Candidatus Curtissbacteria bacterium]|nr:type I methionyl aminopeptidase [Candidatus Curtissbacteria bacterium]
MPQIKTKKEIELMKISGHIASSALKKVLSAVKPGVRTIELDKIANDEIARLGASPSFTTVEDYKWTTCITINEEVVHGIPSTREIKEGDIVSIDTGAIYEGYHSDLATTVPVGEVTQDVRKFLEVGKKTLEKAISEATIGNTIGDISETIQAMIEGAGYGVVKSLSGHGVGRELHEEPQVPGFGKRGYGPKIKQGMTLAIEAIYAQKSGEVFLKKDGWTITTKDGSLGGLFEQTLAVTENGPIVLTPYL